MRPAFAAHAAMLWLLLTARARRPLLPPSSLAASVNCKRSERIWTVPKPVWAASSCSPVRRASGRRPLLASSRPLFASAAWWFFGAPASRATGHHLMGPGSRHLGSTPRAETRSACNANLGRAHHPLSNSYPRRVPCSPIHRSPHRCLLTRRACASYDAVGQFFLTIAQEQPTVLVLDDLHWADPDSLRRLRSV